MFDQLARAIEDVAIPATGDAVAEGYRLLDRLAAKLSQALGAYDADGQWAVEGATSPTAWLRHRTGMNSATAHATVRTARRLHRLPVTRAAWVDGSLSGGQVQAIAANLDDRTAPVFAAQERNLVPTLASLTVEGAARAMQHWRRRAEALVHRDEPRMPDRSLHLSATLGGRWVLDGDLDAEGGSLIATAVRLASTDDTDDEPARSPARRRADALVDVCRFFLDHQRHRAAGRHRPHLNVVVDYRALIDDGAGHVVGTGMPLDGAAVRRLLCDAAVHRVVTDGRSGILDYGTATRTVPANLWAALVLRDGHCRFAGCDRPPEWCEAHHVVPVLEGGPTRLDNLVLKCSRHHHLGHLPGWHEKLLPDGTLVVNDPAGRTRTTHPPGPLPELYPVAA